ncbi:MAG: hypothetical protein ED555_07870 [Allomuricauda sp.]|nr:MAG: hypothetical protein ED555_07870 [Allomuricauda sp.]
MKKINSIILVLAVLFFVSCQETPKEENTREMAQEEEVKPPAGIISLDEAKTLCDNYEERRIAGIKEFEMASNPEEEFVPTQFIDFDFETIDNYLKYVKQEAKKAGVSPDSLRIYLGNYGKEGKEPNRNTVFLLPTTSIDGERGGFYINDDGKAALIRNYWPEDENGGQEGEPRSKASLMPAFNTALMMNGGSLTLNFGQGGPPPFGDF